MPIGTGGGAYLESTAYFLFVGCRVQNNTAWCALSSFGVAHPSPVSAPRIAVLATELSTQGAPPCPSGTRRQGGSVYSVGGSSGDNNYVQSGLQLLPSADVRALASDPAWSLIEAPTLLFELFTDFYTADSAQGSRGVYVHWDVYGDNSIVELSEASDAAGGVYCGPYSHCGCVGCTVAANSARFGGGWYINPRVAQVRTRGRPRFTISAITRALFSRDVFD